MMRQAGRSLPAYRKLREKYSFRQVAQDPALVAEVTLMPIEALKVDAAIIFADIMTPVASLGLDYHIIEGAGPVVEEPVRSIGDVNHLSATPVADAVPELFEAIRTVRKDLEGVAPLIGFAGAPFTLASYLVEGRASREFRATRALMHDDPATWDSLMEKLAELIIEYLREQADAGIQAFQLFDSWVGALTPDEYSRSALPYSKRIFEETRPLGLPRIHFGTRTGALLELMASVDAEVLGVDSTIPLDEAWRRAGAGRAIQGNLDPRALLGPADQMIEQAKDVLRRAEEARPGHIFNLGHGVLPQTPLENLQLLVETVHEFS